MIDELVLEALFAETAEEIPTPDHGMTRVIDEIERSADRSHRSTVARPARMIAAVAAGVVVLAGIGVVVSGGSADKSSFRQASAPLQQADGAAASKSLNSNGHSATTGDQFLRQRAAGRIAVPTDGGDVGGGGTTTQSTPVDGAKIVKTGTLDLQVARDTLRAAVNRVSGIAIGLDGYIANSTTSYDDANPTGQITMRVPVDNFEAAVKQLKALPGVKVLGDSETGKDVTAQYVDLQAQLTAAQTEMGALNSILAGAESIPDTLAVRDRMTAVQTEINRLQGQINVLADKSSYSAIAVALAEKTVTAKTAVAAAPTGLSKAWKDARDGFSNSLEWMIARSGGALIVLLAGLLLLFGIRFLYPVVRRALL